MTEQRSSFKFNLGDLVIEIAGSDLFVSQQIEPFRDLIAQHLKAPRALPKIETDQLLGQAEGETDVAATEEPIYPNAIAIHGDALSIICKAPGKNTSEKAGNLCLIYIWAKKRIMGQSEVPASELRELCKEHAAFDASNFANHLRSRKSHFLPVGVKGSNSKSYKITHPGEAAAKELLDATEAAS